MKALDKESDCFCYLQKSFPALSEAKIKKGIFNGPDIRKLIKERTMTVDQKSAWSSFKAVI